MSRRRKPKLAKLYDRWAFKPDDSDSNADVSFEFAKRDKRLARFIRFKWDQLAEADRKRGVEPSPSKLANRFRWVCDMALVAGLKMSQRRLKQLETRQP